LRFSYNQGELDCRGDTDSKFLADAGFLCTTSMPATMHKDMINKRSLYFIYIYIYIYKQTYIHTHTYIKMADSLIRSLNMCINIQTINSV
jgi:hypothetical protein